MQSIENKEDIESKSIIKKMCFLCENMDFIWRLIYINDYKALLLIFQEKAKTISSGLGQFKPIFGTKADKT